MKAKRALIVIIALIVATTCSACNVERGELGYNGDWEHNEIYHWRAEPDEDGDYWRSEHNIVNGKCGICGYEDPNYSSGEELPDDDDYDDTEDLPVPPPGTRPENPGQDEEPIIDGLSYTLVYGDQSEQGYSVGVGEKGNETHIDVPAEYNGLPIVAIDEYGFKGDTKLQTITLPETLQTIGYEAFANCTALKSLEMPDTVTTLYHRVFFGCTNLEEVKLSANVKIIYAKTFFQCKKLKKIVFPEGLQSISNECFFDCYALNEVVMPKTLQKFGSGVFQNCSNIRKVVAYNLSTFLTIVFGGWNSNPLSGGAALYFNEHDQEVILTHLVFPEETRSIKNFAFCGCSSIVDVYVPETVTAIGYMSFSGCDNLKKFTADSVETIDNNTFSDMDSLEEVSFLSAKTIAADVFLFSKKLKTVHLGKNLAYLGQRSFAYTDLEDIYYEGTESEWENVQKVSGSNLGNWWNYGTGEYRVHFNGGNGNVKTYRGALYV